jgi:hypothetical protein
VSKLLNRILCREKLRFELTNDDKNRVVKTLKKVLNTKGFSINLSGKLKNENEFKLTDKITIGFYIEGGGSPAILKGKFADNDENTVLTIFTRSHILFPFASILIPVYFIPLLLLDNSNSTTEKVLGILFGLVISVIMNFGGNFFKQRLLKKTLNELGLKNK